ncbi:hypothetical protein, partial [Escherichia coli]|uniref:hypothetical protein n=1 Tax=Escherichia coli TaxID=562 RepID=UPI0020105EB7
TVVPSNGQAVVVAESWKGSASTEERSLMRNSFFSKFLKFDFCFGEEAFTCLCAAKKLEEAAGIYKREEDILFLCVTP